MRRLNQAGFRSLQTQKTICLRYSFYVCVEGKRIKFWKYIYIMWAYNVTIPLQRCTLFDRIFTYGIELTDISPKGPQDRSFGCSFRNSIQGGGVKIQINIYCIRSFFSFVLSLSLLSISVAVLSTVALFVVVFQKNKDHYFINAWVHV